MPVVTSSLFRKPSWRSWKPLEKTWMSFPSKPWRCFITTQPGPAISCNPDEVRPGCLATGAGNPLRTPCAGVAGNYHKTESFFAIKEDPIHRSRNSGYYDNRGGHDRQYPKARPRPTGRLIAKFAELPCRAANAGHMEREIAVQFMSQQAPQTAHLLYMFDDQSGFTAQLPQTVRRIAKIIVRLFVQAERKRRGKNERSAFVEYSGHFGDQLPRIRCVLENLDTEHRIERAIVEWQPIAFIQTVRTRASEIRGCRFERSLPLDTEVFIDVRTENALELLIAAAYIEQLSAGSWGNCL